MNVISVSYHVDLKEVQSDPRMAGLLSAPAQQAPFERLDFWQALATHCGLPPLLVCARSEEHMAVLPLRRGKGELTAFANWYSFRTGPVFSPGAPARQLLSAMARHLARKTRRLRLEGLTAEDGRLDTVRQGFRAAGWVCFAEPCDTNHVLRLNGRSFAAYMADRPGPLRTTLKRKGARVQTAILDVFDAQAWAAYEAIYAESWKPSEGSPAFLRAFAEAEGAAGRLRLGLAFADGQPVAAQFWTVEGTCAFIHKLAHLEAARPLSPGTTLSAALFAHVIDRDRVDMVDFGTGDDPYKRDWMEEMRPRFRLLIYRPASPANWLPMLRNLASLLARKAKRG